MFNPTLATFNKSSSVPIFGQMIVLADTSGSTNNVETRGRYSRRSYSNINVIEPSNTESDMPAENTTKPITIAISEGIAHTFAELANTFDMTGVKLVLGSFDSNYHQSVNAELKSSKELYDFATQIDSMLVKDFSSTNMTKGLDSAFEDFKKNTLLIIASDGRPDDPNSVLEKLDEISQKFKANSKTFDSFVIGAGSIQESVHGSTNICSMRHNRSVENVSNERMMDRIRSNSSAECDHEFLKFMMEKARVGAYSGAYKDYKDLISGFKIFVDQVQTYDPYKDKSFHVKIGSNLIKLSDDVQNKIKKLIDIGGDYLNVQFNGEDYILAIANGVEPYQIHVQECRNYVSTVDYGFDPTNNLDQSFVEKIDPQMKTFFEIFSNVQHHIPPFATEAVFVVIKSDGSKKYFKPDKSITNDRVFRVRKLIIK